MSYPLRLSDATLSSARAQRPGYDRAQITPGIVHLGIGAFHRAHQAALIDDLLPNDPRWGIIGASLRSPATASALNPQDGLFTLVTQKAESRAFRIIGSVSKVMSATPDTGSLIAQMIDPGIRIVSLTVTEKGYCHIPATGGLDQTHPDIVHDVANPDRPKSAPGMITAALSLRKTKGLAPFTVLSCDNLPNNGVVTSQVVLGLARLQDAKLADWIETNVSFPSTMVDRIVPATTDRDRAEVTAQIGVQDAWPVVTEPFWQWVIEDKFCAGRPAFESVGVLLTDDVKPFELMKLRLLNGSHSALAYLGLLAGHETVSDAMADPKIAGFVGDLMSGELASTLVAPKGINLDAYQADLLDRFRNPALNHKLSQIAMDGSQKLPQRILDPIRDRMKVGSSIEGLARVVAAWLEFVHKREAGGYMFDLVDPLADVLRANARADLLRLPQVFGDDLSNSQMFLTAVGRHLK